MAESYTYDETVAAVRDILSGNYKRLIPNGKIPSEYEIYDVNTLYTSRIVKQGGKVTDQDVFYTDVIAKYLLEHWDAWHDKITRIYRQSSYKQSGHDGKCNEETFGKKGERVEDNIAKHMFCMSQSCHGCVGQPAVEFDFLGKIFDYQIPLKNVESDKGVGAIDIVSQSGNTVYLIELKKQDNDKDTLLRSGLEAYTYSQQYNPENFRTSFNLTPDVEIKPVVLIFKDSFQYKEFKDGKHKAVIELLKKMGVDVYAMTGDALGHAYDYKIVEKLS